MAIPVDLGRIGKPKEEEAPEEITNEQIVAIFQGLIRRQDEIIKVLDIHREHIDAVGQAILDLRERNENLRKDHRRLAKYVNGRNPSDSESGFVDSDDSAPIETTATPTDGE